MAIPKDNMRSHSQNRQRDPISNSMKCPSCGFNLIRRTNGKYKLRTRVLIFTRNGNTMGICPKCKTNLKIPIALDSNTDTRSKKKPTGATVRKQEP